MKKQNCILFLLMILIQGPLFGQTKFYTIQNDVKKIKRINVVGEECRLTFYEDSINKINLQELKTVFPAALAASIIPALIDLGTKITTKIIENNVKKYTNEFSGKGTNTLEAVNIFLSCTAFTPSKATSFRLT